MKTSRSCAEINERDYSVTLNVKKAGNSGKVALDWDINSQIEHLVRSLRKISYVM
jgi:hypothetical protein